MTGAETLRLPPLSCSAPDRDEAWAMVLVPLVVAKVPALVRLEPLAQVMEAPVVR